MMAGSDAGVYIASAPGASVARVHADGAGRSAGPTCVCGICDRAAFSDCVGCLEWLGVLGGRCGERVRQCAATVLGGERVMPVGALSGSDSFLIAIDPSVPHPSPLSVNGTRFE